MSLLEIKKELSEKDPFIVVFPVKPLIFVNSR